MHAREKKLNLELIAAEKGLPKSDEGSPPAAAPERGKREEGDKHQEGISAATQGGLGST